MNTRHILMLLSALIIVSSCKKDNEDNSQVNQQVSSNDIRLELNNYWGGETLMYNTVYDVNGVDVKFQEIRYYLSNFQAIDDEGNMAILDQVLLVNAGTSEELKLGDLSLSFDQVYELSFMLGLDSLTNHSDPTLAASPLNDGTMHWGWDPASGYKFIKIEGERDINGDGTFEAFSIHAAMDNLKRSMNKDVNQNITDHSLTIVAEIDYQMWFDGIDLSPDPLNGTHGSSALTNGIADNVDASISIP